MENKLLDSIRLALKELEISPRAWSLKAGIGADGIRNIQRGKSESPQIATIYALADAIGWYVGRSGKDPILIKPPKIVGEIGAGAEVEWIDDYDQRGDLDDAPAPPDLTPGTVAVRVRGESMWPAFKDGDLLYYSDHASNWDDLLGKECIVKLKDGRGFVKILERGSRKGRYSLGSHNAPPLTDQAIEWVARVRSVVKK